MLMTADFLNLKSTRRNNLDFLPITLDCNIILKNKKKNLTFSSITRKPNKTLIKFTLSSTTIGLFVR